MAQESKKVRSVNYTTEEKLLLLNLVNINKDVIECKKTDMVSNNEKEKAWKNIENKYNSRAPNNVYRSVESLKKYYENLKKKTRKQAAEDRIQTIITGGGSKETKLNDPTFDFTMSILNKKTVYGLQNMYDCDRAISNITRESTTNIQDDLIEKNQVSNNPDESEVNAQNTSDQQTENNLVMELHELPDLPVLTWDSYKPANLQTPLSRPLKDKKIEKGWTKRRRPTAPTSACSADLSKQYSDLATIKLEVAELQKKLMQDESKQKKICNERESELRQHSLELDIEIKKILLQRETQELNFRKQLLTLELQIKEQQLKKLEDL